LRFLYEKQKKIESIDAKRAEKQLDKGAAEPAKSVA
jgi:nitrate/nitrite transport system ATP-binding protein